MSSMDDIKDARDSAVKSLESARDQASVALDDGLAAASSAARSSIAYVMGAANEGKQLVEQESQVRPPTLPPTLSARLSDWTEGSSVACGTYQHFLRH